MTVREVRVSPTGDAVAIRSDSLPEHWNAWGVIDAINGGHWCNTNAVADWVVAIIPALPEPEPEPEPEPAPGPEV